MHISPQLLKACIDDDRKAQSELYRLCFGMLMAVCMRYHSQEEDAVAALNQGFLKILNNLDKRKDHVPFEAWIRRIMINTLIDEFRKNKKRKSLMESTELEEIREVQVRHVDYNTADQEFDAESLERMIQALPPMSRQVFNLFAIDGFSHQEISEQLGISVGTSKWHVSSARQTIQKRMIALEKKNERISL